jgi:hypothetical protein
VAEEGHRKLQDSGTTPRLLNADTHRIARLAVGLEDDFDLAATGETRRKADVDLIDSGKLRLAASEEDFGRLAADRGCHRARCEPDSGAIEDQHDLLAVLVHRDRAGDEAARSLVELRGKFESLRAVRGDAYDLRRGRAGAVGVGGEDGGTFAT